MIDEIIKGIIEGLGEVGISWYEWWLKHKANQNPINILDEMLRNPRWRFREFETLARVIYDTTEGHIITSALLLNMGARHNVGDRDTWTMDKYWEQDNEGNWRLNPDVTPGKI